MLRVVEHYSGTDTGRQRRANEDSLLARSPLFVIADGMGGAQAGEVASRVAVETFQTGLRDGTDPQSALADQAEMANARIHDLSQTNPEQAGMGTTLTALYVGEHEVTIAQVGDSRAYCLRDRQLERLTDDHSLVDELIRQGRLTPEEAVEHPQRSIITRALGPEASVEVDTRSFRGRAGDVYLLCSDGLTTMLPEDEVLRTLLAHPRLHEAGEALIAAANEAGGRDNITVILLRLGEVEASAPSPLEDEVTVVGLPAVVLPTSEPGMPAGAGAQEPDTTAPAGAGPRGPDTTPAPATVAGPQRPDSTPAPATVAVTRAPDVTSALASPELERSAQPDASRSALENTGRIAAPRRPRRPGPHQGGPRRKRRRRFRLGTALALLTVLGLLAGGAYLAFQSVYFIGTNEMGLVTVFNGLPYELPGGLSLYRVEFVSGVSGSTISHARRRTLLDDSLRSESDANELVRQLELGHLSGG